MILQINGRALFGILHIATALLLASCTGDQLTKMAMESLPDLSECPPPDSKKKSSAQGVRSVSGLDSTVSAVRRMGEVSSEETDMKCDNIVRSFDISQNAFQLAGAGLSVAVHGWFDSSGATKEKALKAMRSCARHLNWLPLDVEIAYGEYWIEDMKKNSLLLSEEGKGRDRYKLARQIVDEINSGVADKNPYKWKVYVNKDAGSNALALPGGIIVIDSDLLSPEGRSKGYFAIAHEMSHILQRHETRLLQARVFDAAYAAGKGRDFFQKVGSNKIDKELVLGLLLTGKAMFVKHSSEQELQADSCAVRLLSTGLNSKQAVVKYSQAFLNSLPPPKAKVTPVNDMEYVIDLVLSPIDRHPTTSERKENLRVAIRSFSK